MHITNERNIALTALAFALSALLFSSKAAQAQGLNYCGPTAVDQCDLKCSNQYFACGNDAKADHFLCVADYTQARKVCDQNFADDKLGCDTCLEDAKTMVLEPCDTAFDDSDMACISAYITCFGNC